MFLLSSFNICFFLPSQAESCEWLSPSRMSLSSFNALQFVTHAALLKPPHPLATHLHSVCTSSQRVRHIIPHQLPGRRTDLWSPSTGSFCTNAGLWTMCNIVYFVVCVIFLCFYVFAFVAFAVHVFYLHVASKCISTARIVALNGQAVSDEVIRLLTMWTHGRVCAGVLCEVSKGVDKYRSNTRGQ